MLDRATQRSRPKRRIFVNIQLSKQDLQEYLDDGYTAADIAKDFNVSPADITAKIRKFGVKKNTKLVKRRGRPASPQKRKRGRPPKIQSTPRKEKTNPKSEGTPSKQDLHNAVTQVIQENPEEAVDYIHELLSSMGFDLEKSSVEDQIKKWKADSKTPVKRGQKSPQEGENSEESYENDETGRGENTDLSHQSQLTGGVSEDEEDASTSKNVDINDNFDGENEPCAQKQMEERPAEPVKKRGPGRPRKLRNSEKPETMCKRISERRKEPLTIGPRKRGRPRKQKNASSCEASEEESVKRQRRNKSNSSSVRDINEDVTDEDSAGEDGDSDKEWTETKKPKKRGRKPGQKTKAKTIQTGPPRKKGRPCLNLSEESLRLCVENRLPVGEIALALGACRQSVNRYLNVYKMRRKDRFTNISDDELDKIVSEMCRSHPEWGQVRIQEELRSRGLHFRRNQVRNSVRRVDPVGIELRKLNNLKMRWNRGSLKRLDQILPADGINMTSTESFLSRPPRNGLNGLNVEESVRLLKSIVTTHKKPYVDEIKCDMAKQNQNETGNGTASVEGENGSISKDGQRDETQEGLMKAAQEVENKTDTFSEASEERSDENIGPVMNHQQELRMDAPLLSESEYGKEYSYRQMLYNMVMSTNQKTERAWLSQSGDSKVNISKEDLEKCVEDGFSSSRIAEKFGTTIRNVRKLLKVHKLTMSTRFEKISEEKLDEIVRDAVQEFSIQKGSAVYGYVRKKGFRIRKVDIHKSVSRLYPKGLHRQGSSILKESWDAVSEPHPSDMGSSVTQDGGQGNVNENGETVVMLNSEDLAQIVNGEGTITLVQQQEPESSGNEGVSISEEQVSSSIANALVTAGTVVEIVNIDFPGNGDNVANGQVVNQDSTGSHIVQYDGTQQSSHDVVLVLSDGVVTGENVSNIVTEDNISSGNETGDTGLTANESELVMATGGASLVNSA